ncbi:MAG: APC family permease [Desulfarculaceae bacterium]|nr:APC family permease [Desulfarculaceae bacterium]MCF8070853.1 APC family permease [Desulfarculaceae bacterium]MCF8102291.1 APC family permease [Desulfarculaceae bacterium]MCF8118026.1 APC family permease [Desulfarculaceae bacterium]
MGSQGKGGGKIGYWEASAIGVGGMVGGGIFAVLGLSVQLARGGTPVAFAIAGAVALITAYSYAKLSVRYPNRGGTVVFLDRVFGVNYFTGSANVLLWLSYVVMLALYSYAFGSYGATFFPGEHNLLAKHLLISLGIVGPTVLNVASAKIIGEAEIYVVGVKLSILLFFLAMGFGGVEPQRLAMSHWEPAIPLVAGGMIIFVAYEGFELIANTGEDIRNPKKNLPRAFYSSVIFVILLYVAIAVVCVGSLPIAELVGARDYALAEAARPFLGSAGFTLIVVAALLSTFSAINATLYGSARLSYVIAKEGELPAALERQIWGQPLEGLFITSGLALILANTADLSSISTLGSGGFLLIFAAVNAANLADAKETKCNRCLAALGAVACLAAFGAMAWQSISDDPARAWVLVAMLGGAFLLEGVYRLAGFKGLRKHKV